MKNNMFTVEDFIKTTMVDMENDSYRPLEFDIRDDINILVTIYEGLMDIFAPIGVDKDEFYDETIDRFVKSIYLNTDDRLTIEVY
jgi:hypothetical protein